MPLSKYDREFGGKKGSARKAHAAMVKQYGEKKGESVFYALKNKNAAGERGSRRERLIRQFQAKHRGKKRGN